MVSLMGVMGTRVREKDQSSAFRAMAGLLPEQLTGESGTVMPSAASGTQATIAETLGAAEIVALRSFRELSKNILAKKYMVSEFLKNHSFFIRFFLPKCQKKTFL